MSGFLKPASSPMKRLSETRFTEHTRLTETRRCKSSWSIQTSVSRNINSRTVFGKICRIESVFIEVVLKLKLEYLVSYKVKKCKSHKRSYRKYWFNFLNTKLSPISGETVPLRGQGSISLTPGQTLYSEPVWSSHSLWRRHVTIPSKIS